MDEDDEVTIADALAANADAVNRYAAAAASGSLAYEETAKATRYAADQHRYALVTVAEKWTSMVFFVALLAFVLGLAAILHG